MNLALIVVLSLVVLVSGVLAVAASRPNAFRFERSTEIKAPPATIFPFVNDFRQWAVWSPYEKLDADLEKTFAGAPSGKGAIYEWAGKKAGTGRMEIVDTAAPSKVVIKLDFMKPFEAHNTAEFTFVERGDTTHVTWAMFGQSPFMSKLMGVFVDMDAFLGKDFEAGLASMKARSEASSST